MKITLIPIFFCVCSMSLFGQITYNGCTNFITGPAFYTLSLSGTTNDGGTIRNSYASLPVSCSAGVCNFTMTWNSGQSRWELALPAAGVLHYNASASAPNPPDLTLGSWVNAQGCSSISTLSGDVQSSIVLPVELLSFVGKVDHTSVNLSWQTAREVNNEKFEIEFSVDGKEFRKVAEIAGNGTTSEQKDYVFDIENSENGLHYYRLKQIDFDGQFDYSKMISVEVSRVDEEAGNFYPNPSRSSIVHLDYRAEMTKNIEVAVFEITGRLISVQKYSVLKGKNNLEFNFSEVGKGVYFVRLGNEKKSTRRRLIIE